MVDDQPLDYASLRAQTRSYCTAGYAVLPVRFKVPWDVARRAPLEAWETLRLTLADLEDRFARFAGTVTGCGVVLGPPSAGLTDIDLDALEAIAAADAFLPATDCVFGRASKVRSHRIYTSDAVRTVKFKDVDAPKTMLVELRSTGAQTVFPPAQHESGELVRYDSAGSPARVASNDLRVAVAHVAATALLARHWPRHPGSRHDLALALAGCLLRGGLDEDTAARIIATATRVAGDPESGDRAAAVRTTLQRITTGKQATGRPQLIELLGARGSAVVEKLTEWLGLRTEVPWPTDVDAPRAHARQRTSEPPPPPDWEPGLDADERDDGRNPWTQALSAPAFLAQIEDTPDWLEDGVLMPGAITRLNSPRGLGKTNVGHAYAVRQARAGRRVLLFDRDNPKGEIRRRLRAWGAEALETLEILSREHAPSLTDPRAWKAFPLGKYDLIVLDSWDASAEGVGEQDSAKPSKAQAVLLDLAHRENGPAVLVLANTTKSGDAGRGAGTLEDREDVVLEVRDATGLTPTGRSDWWNELPDASRASWGARAARRAKQDRLRLAFTYSKLRVGGERDPFVLEIDFTTVPWGLRLVTDAVVAAGQAAADAAAQQEANRTTSAMEQLRVEVEQRAAAGEKSYGKKMAAKFLTVVGLTWKQAHEAVDRGNGTHWRLEQLTTKRGHPLVLNPLNSPAARSKTPAQATFVAQGLQDQPFGTSASSADVPKRSDENPCAAMASESGVLEREGWKNPPAKVPEAGIPNRPIPPPRDGSHPGDAPPDPYGPTPPAAPCRTCGGSTWHRAGAGWTCSTCHPDPTSAPDSEEALLMLARQRDWRAIEYESGHSVGGSEERWRHFAAGGLPAARRAALVVLTRVADPDGPDDADRRPARGRDEEGG